MKPVIWGTAGHIDHGKTALVESMTGTNTDRLQEEQNRGLTIDIGFAFLSDEISFIDVPGHEKFIKNMVTGVSTIDAGLLVVAADDGIMPQTREHLAILQLLGVETGCIALTKTDLVDSAWLDLVEETVYEHVQGTFLQSAPVIRTSAVSGEGIDELSERITELSARLPRRIDRGIPRLPVDRAFSVKGFGTVVTGSVTSGEFHQGDTVELLPSRREVKVRGIQTHGQDTKSVGISERAALNIANIEVDAIERGDQLTSPGNLHVSDEIYATVDYLSHPADPLKQNQRVRIHLGTTEILARCTVVTGQQIDPGDSGLVKLRLEDRAVVAFGDRYIMRFYSPMMTIGGGRVLYPEPLKYLNRAQTADRLAALDQEDLAGILRGFANIYRTRLLSLADFSRELTFHEKHLTEPLVRLREQGDFRAFEVEEKLLYGLTDKVECMEKEILDSIKEYHEHHSKEPGYPRSQLIQEVNLPDETVSILLEGLVSRGEIEELGPLIKRPGFSVRLTPREQEQKKRLEEFILSEGLCPPSENDLAEAMDFAAEELRQFLKLLQYEKAVERLPDNLYFHVKSKDMLRQELRRYFTDHRELEIGQFKDIIGGSRKYAIPLLEYTDQLGWTRRDDDVRKKGNLEQSTTSEQYGD